MEITTKNKREMSKKLDELLAETLKKPATCDTAYLLAYIDGANARNKNEMIYSSREYREAYLCGYADGYGDYHGYEDLPES